MSRRIAALLVLIALVPANAARAQRPTDFSRLVARLSEPGGYFASDNLVSNETSYLHVMGALRERGIRGGVYLGVGPEQGFSYIAEVRPELAILIDIRRDNLLLHLLLKAMFETARDRTAYLGLLYGRPVDDRAPRGERAPLDSILAYLDRTPLDSGLHARQHAALVARVARTGVPLSDEDRATLRRFHDEFAYTGLDITYTTRRGAMRRNFPDARRLYRETDLEGRPASYLATEDRWRVVRDLERRGRVVPAVGDLAGSTAMPAIAAYLRERGLQVTAFYTSNVEQYLMQYGTFGAFARNVAALPLAPWGVIIRSRFFFRGMPPMLQSMDHLSTQQVHAFPLFLALLDRPEGLSYGALLLEAEDMVPDVPVLRP